MIVVWTGGARAQKAQMSAWVLLPTLENPPTDMGSLRKMSQKVKKKSHGQLDPHHLIKRNPVFQPCEDIAPSAAWKTLMEES